VYWRVGGLNFALFIILLNSILEWVADTNTDDIMSLQTLETRNEMFQNKLNSFQKWVKHSSMGVDPKSKRVSAELIMIASFLLNYIYSRVYCLANTSE